MDDQQIDDGHGGQRTNDDAKNKVAIKSKYRIFPPGYFANNDWAILLLFFAALFGGVIIPNSPRAKTVCAIFCLVCCVVLVIHGFFNRNTRSAEEIEEQFQQNTNEALGSLQAGFESVTSRLNASDARLDVIDRRLVGRTLTPQQIDFITKALLGSNSIFKMIIRYSQFARDGSQYARRLAEPLHAAGWEFVTADFKAREEFPLQFCLNPEDLRLIPHPVRVLNAAMLSCNAIGSDTIITPNPEIPQGALGIYVGMAP